MSAKEVKKKQNRLLVGTAISLVVCMVIGATVLTSAAEFRDYKPPSRWNIDWNEWRDEFGNPASGTKPNHIPTWRQDYPYRALLFGGNTARSSTQKHDSYVIVIYSKVPEIDIFTYEYRPGTKATGQTGYIRARYDSSDPLLKLQKAGDPNSCDVKITTHQWMGVTSGPQNLQAWTLSNHHSKYTYFHFDFWYQCCGTLKIKGLDSLTDVPYPYILTCTDSNGNGGGSSHGSSSSGGGGGSSSGGGGSSSGGGGSSSGGGGSSSGVVLFSTGSG